MGGREQGEWKGEASVVEVPLTRLMDQSTGGLGLSGPALAEQVEAAQRVAGEVLALHVVSDALSEAAMFDLRQEAGVGGQGSCIAASRVAWTTLDDDLSPKDRGTELKVRTHQQHVTFCFIIYLTLVSFMVYFMVKVAFFDA